MGPPRAGGEGGVPGLPARDEGRRGDTAGAGRGEEEVGRDRGDGGENGDFALVVSGFRWNVFKIVGFARLPL